MTRVDSTVAGMRIALCANTDWYLANFRLDLACAMQCGGATVHCIAPNGKYLKALAAQGFETHALNMGQRSYSVADNRKTLKHLTRLYREIQPDLVHHFTPRCVVLGSMAAGKAGVPYVVNALTGLGHVFTSGSLKSRLARPVLRRLLKKQLRGDRRAVIFQNDADMQELLNTGAVDRERCYLIRGSGVDPEKFRAASGERGDDQIRVLFASRLIAEKGVHELVDAMGEVVQSHPRAVLWIAGAPYAQNPTSLTESDLQRLRTLPWLTLLGHVDDMPGLLREVDIVALPSYREGTPKILLEAASSSLPIVATDIPGCRGVVDHARSGFLVPPGNRRELAGAIVRLCADRGLRASMGQYGRKIVQTQFTSEAVIGKTLKVYRDLTG